MKKIRLRKRVSEIPEVKTQENEELGLGFESYTHFLKLCRLYTRPWVLVSC